VAADRTARLAVKMPPAVRRELGARAAAAGTSANHEANLILARALGVDPAPSGGHVERGAFARSALGQLADRGAPFTAAEAVRATGGRRCATLVHLRELVRAGALVERVVPGASGGAKEWTAAPL
jgi:hypothetical protein